MLIRWLGKKEGRERNIFNGVKMSLVQEGQKVLCHATKLLLATLLEHIRNSVAAFAQ